MFMRRKQKQIAALLDAERQYAPSDASALETSELQAYRDALLRLREGAQAAAARAPEISDGQFGAFMTGIREGIEAPAPRRAAGLLATASLAAAALVLVMSLLIIFSRPNEPVRATEVESAHTELDGAAVDCYDTTEGTTTVWVTMPENDLW
ncbi:MAG TPA: hypothetical protein ENN29_14165 [Candidatus Hydrogenedentes bacterium]|nr:hypothetical protein [Candidatus Hydrogenedentota bacterium]